MSDLTADDLLRVALSVINSTPNKRMFGSPSYPEPFNERYHSYEVAEAIEKFLEDNRGFTITLVYPKEICEAGDSETFQSSSSAATWREAVLEVAEEMVAGCSELDGTGSAYDEIAIQDIFIGRQAIRQMPGADVYAVVRVTNKRCRVLTLQEQDDEDHDPLIGKYISRHEGWYIKSNDGGKTGRIRRLASADQFRDHGDAVWHVRNKAKGSRYHTSATRLHDAWLALNDR